MWRRLIRRIAFDDRLLDDISFNGEMGILFYVTGIPLASLILALTAPASVSHIFFSKGLTQRNIDRIGLAGVVNLTVHEWSRRFGWTWIFLIASTVNNMLLVNEILVG